MKFVLDTKIKYFRNILSYCQSPCPELSRNIKDASTYVSDADNFYILFNFFNLKFIATRNL